MKTLLRHIKRLLYRLVCWINYPTSRERMWGMYALGKAQGIKEALKTLPIVQVQPKTVSEPLHLPPGMWSRLYYEVHPEHRAAIPSQHEHTYWPKPPEDVSWLNSKPPISVKDMTPEQIAAVSTIRDLTPDSTEEMPAVVKLLHERWQETRKPG